MKNRILTGGAILASGGMLAFGLAACGGSSPPTPTPTPTHHSTPTPTPNTRTLGDGTVVSLSSVKTTKPGDDPYIVKSALVTIHVVGGQNDLGLSLDQADGEFDVAVANTGGGNPYTDNWTPGSVYNIANGPTSQNGEQSGRLLVGQSADVTEQFDYTVVGTPNTFHGNVNVTVKVQLADTSDQSVTFDNIPVSS